MLAQLKVSNFRSIYNLTLDFTFGEKRAPKGYQESLNYFFFTAAKKRYVPCLAFYGANASGKTNIIRALKTIQKIVKNGVSNDIFDPNRLNIQTPTTSFEITFVVQDSTYCYFVDYNNQRIFSEKLLCNEDEIFSTKDSICNCKNITTENYDEKKLIDIYNVECINDQQNRSFLGVIGDRYTGLNTNIRIAHDFITNKLRIALVSPDLLQSKSDLAKLFQNEQNSEESIQRAFNEITKALRKLDVDISRMSLTRKRQAVDLPQMSQILRKASPKQIKIEQQNGELIFTTENIISYHKNIEGTEIPFNFLESESAGTQAVSGLLGFLLTVLKQGGTAVIDEIDRSLHPLIVVEIVRMFKDKEYNPKNAQLIFTIHDVMLLETNLLRVSEIGIVNKTLRNGTTVKRLCEDETIKNVHKFMKLYIDGALGGIPFPYI